MQGSARLGRAAWRGSVSGRWETWRLVSLALSAKGWVRLQQHQLPALAKQGMWLNYNDSLLAVLLESKTPLLLLPGDVPQGNR